MQLTHRPRHPGDIRRFLDEANASPYIGIITEQEVAGWMEQDCLRWCYVADALAGVVAWEPFGEDWCELGPYYVMQTHRGQGIGRQLVRVSAGVAAQRRLFAVTKNPAMAHLLRQQGLEQTPFTQLPAPVRLHLRRKLTLLRLWWLLRKFSPEAPTYLIATERVSAG